jgi:hypothetical protein
MDAQEYPIRHFELMVALANRLRGLPAQVLDHEYRYSAFGSWCTRVRFNGQEFSIIFDGRDQELRLERHHSTGADIILSPVIGDDIDDGLDKVLARIQAAV